MEKISEYGVDFRTYCSPEIKIRKREKCKKGILQSFKPE
jgi:hypothetical protein